MSGQLKLKAGMQVCISHPRLVATGMDYLEYERAQSVVLFFLKPVMLQAGINCPRIERQWARNVSPVRSTDPSTRILCRALGNTSFGKV
jgi:hypothetical protein